MWRLPRTVLVKTAEEALKEKIKEVATLKNLLLAKEEEDHLMHHPAAEEDHLMLLPENEEAGRKAEEEPIA